MRRLALLSLLATTFTATGCVAVSAKGNRWGTRYQVFVAKDQVYVFDSVEGCVAKVDVSNPPPFEPHAQRADCENE